MSIPVRAQGSVAREAGEREEEKGGGRREEGRES